MVGFGGKQAWLAVRDTAAAAVLDALGLRDLGEVPWREGVDLAYLTDDRVVLTPPLAGAGGAAWTLAAGGPRSSLGRWRAMGCGVGGKGRPGGGWVPPPRGGATPRGACAPGARSRGGRAAP